MGATTGDFYQHWKEQYGGNAIINTINLILLQRFLQNWRLLVCTSYLSLELDLGTICGLIIVAHYHKYVKYLHTIIGLLTLNKTKP